jgi:CheY-like chemotaxis protein
VQDRIVHKVSINLNAKVTQECSAICSATVLLVDDNPFNLVPLEHMLRDTFKIESVSFESAKEALDCYVRRLQNKCCWRSFRLVLTDI